MTAYAHLKTNHSLHCSLLWSVRLQSACEALTNKLLNHFFYQLWLLQKLLQKMSIDWCCSAVSACFTCWLAWQQHSPVNKDMGAFCFCSCDVSQMFFVPRLWNIREIVWLVINMFAHCASESRHYPVFAPCGYISILRKSRGENMYPFRGKKIAQLWYLSCRPAESPVEISL